MAIAAGDYYTVGLRADGSVVAVGSNAYGQRDVSDWQDIVAVTAGSFHTVGLRADGSLVAVGRNNSGQCDVGDWQYAAADSKHPDGRWSPRGEAEASNATSPVSR